SRVVPALPEKPSRLKLRQRVQPSQDKCASVEQAHTLCKTHLHGEPVDLIPLLRITCFRHHGGSFAPRKRTSMVCKTHLHGDRLGGETRQGPLEIDEVAGCEEDCS